MSARQTEGVRRLFTIAAVLGLALSACGGGPATDLSEGEVFDGSATTPPPGAVPPTEPAAGSPAPAPGGPTSPGVPGPSASPRPGGGGSGSGGGATPPTVDPKRAHGPTGSFAPTLLREDLTVEVLAQSGAQASGPAFSHLMSSLSEVAGRTVGTTGPISVEGGAKDWTADELKATADAKAVRPAGSATLRMLFLHGTFEGNDSVLGVAVRGDVLAIFTDRVRSAGGLVGNSTGVERAVMLHEAGHVLGLVDLYLNTGRADKEHPGHSPNQESVMYWAVESTAIGQVFGANPPDKFDAADRADLARIKSGK